MRIQVLQHVPFEGPASIATWAAARGHSLATTRLDAGECLPRLEDLDWLAVMGGPMNVDEEGRYPWLVAEKAFIRGAIEAGKRILGVCLGGQLIAAALGAPVQRAVQREIGWFPLTLTPEGRSSPVGEVLPERFLAFHWHGDSFDIPEGAILLASSAACRNQAFLYGGRVLGLQFHLEATAEGVADLLAHCGDDLVAGPYVQGAAAVQAGTAACAQLNGLLWRLLDRLAMPD